MLEGPRLFSVLVSEKYSLLDLWVEARGKGAGGCWLVSP